jgi:hypothetical protein
MPPPAGALVLVFDRDETTTHPQFRLKLEASAGPVLRGVWAPRHWLDELRVVNDGRQGPVEVAEDPGRRGITPKRSERVAGVNGHRLTVQRLPRCVSTSADYFASRGGGNGGTGYTFDAGGLRPVPGAAAL